jgi:glycosyltransferase involved in cell wall biosynthesis
LANVLVHAKGERKGVVVFTHKEYYNFFKSELAKPFRGFIKQHFYVGVHFGWYHKDPDICDFVDFLLASAGTVEFSEPSPIRRLFMSSRNFVSKRFDNSAHRERFWDITCISRDAKFKNLDRFLHAIRRLFDQYGLFNVALVATGQTSDVRDKTFFYNELVDDYYSLFNEQERKSFVLIKPDPALGSGGINESFIAFILANSKVLTLFSTLEGDTRVPSEGLLSGCKIVVSDCLKGGGRDLLTEYNSEQFSHFDVAHEALYRAITSQADYQLLEHDRLQVSEDNSIVRLKEFICDLFDESSPITPDDVINTDYLSRRLPGHHHDVPWAAGRDVTADILTVPQLHKLFEYCEIVV